MFPLVSLGIPTYNRCGTLERTLRSVLMQDYPNLEIIVSDNASTDGTQVLMEQYAAQDNRIRYRRELSNCGPTENFKRILDVAQGVYFQWLADDDYLGEANYISTCVNLIQTAPKGTIVCGKTITFHPVTKEWLDLDVDFDLIEEDPRDRVLSYYQRTSGISYFYGLMERLHLQHFVLTLDFVKMMNRVGGDYHFLASLVFAGKVRSAPEVTLFREHNWLDGVRRTKELAQQLGVSGFQESSPLSSTVFGACTDLAWRLGVYGPVDFERLAWAWRIYQNLAQMLTERTGRYETTRLLTILRCLDGLPDLSALRQVRFHIAQQWLQTNPAELTVESSLVQAHRFLLWSGLPQEPLLVDEIQELDRLTQAQPQSPGTELALQLYQGWQEPTVLYPWLWAVMVEEIIRQPVFFAELGAYGAWEQRLHEGLTTLLAHCGEYNAHYLRDLARLPLAGLAPTTLQLWGQLLVAGFAGELAVDYSFSVIERSRPRLGLLVTNPYHLRELHLDSTAFTVLGFSLLPDSPEGLTVLPQGLEASVAALRAADLDILLAVGEPHCGVVCPLALLLAYRLARLQLFCGVENLGFDTVDYRLPTYFLQLEVPKLEPLDLEENISLFVSGTPLNQVLPEVLAEWTELMGGEGVLVLPLPPPYRPFPQADWEIYHRHKHKQISVRLVSSVVPYLAQATAYLDSPHCSNDATVQASLRLGVPVLGTKALAEDNNLTTYLMQLWEQHQTFPALLDYLEGVEAIVLFTPDWHQVERLRTELQSLDSALTVLILGVTPARQEVIWELMAVLGEEQEGPTLIPLAPLSPRQHQQLHSVLLKKKTQSAR